MKQYSIWIKRPASVDPWQRVETHLIMWLRDTEALLEVVSTWNKNGIVVLSSMELRQYEELKK